MKEGVSGGPCSLEDLSVYSHLSNNSIAKHSDEFKSKDVSDGNMWRLETFREHLAETRGAEGAAAWETRIKPAMINAVVSSLKCAVDMIENRKNSFDVYGYDFVLDDDLRPWLLEINASPSMEHSTPVTAELCPQAIDDTIKVVVDVPEQIKKNGGGGSNSNGGGNSSNKNGGTGGGGTGGGNSNNAGGGGNSAAAAVVAETPGGAATGDAAIAAAADPSETAARAAVVTGGAAGAEAKAETGAAPADPAAAAGGAGGGGGAAGDGGVGFGAVIDVHDGLDRGRWELVCKDASYVPNPAYCGLELTVTGAGIKPQQPKGRRKKIAAGAAV